MSLVDKCRSVGKIYWKIEEGDCVSALNAQLSGIGEVQGAEWITSPSQLRWMTS